MASVKINFDNKLHANAFAMYMEETGLSEYKESSAYENAIDAGALHLDENVEVSFDEDRNPDHEITTIELEKEEDEDDE
jgi:hypothetical protein